MRIIIIYGPPSSGKSTYVKSKLKPNDAYFDYDEVMQSISGLPYQEHNRMLHDTVISVRDNLLNVTGIDTFYIITTFLSDDLTKLNAEYIQMNTDYPTCIERLYNTDRKNKDELRIQMVKWFEKYFNQGLPSSVYSDEADRKRFYKSRRWSKLRQQVLERDNFECQMCKSKGRLTLDSIKQTGIKKKPTLNVHHVMELEYYPGYAMDKNNLITVCIRCHNAIHDRYQPYEKKNKLGFGKEKW